MCTRGVWQLSNVLVRFCKQGGSSEGTRAFIKTELAAYAEANPSISINVVHTGGKHPLAVGQYRDGTTKEVDLRNKRGGEVAFVMDKLRSTATGRVRKFTKPVTTHVPSVQGVWDPSTRFEGFELREAAR